MQRLRIRSDHIRLTSIVYSEHLFVSYLSNSYCFSFVYPPFTPPRKNRAVYPFVSYFSVHLILSMLYLSTLARIRSRPPAIRTPSRYLFHFFSLSSIKGFFLTPLKCFSINPLKCSFHMREESCIQDSSLSFTQSI